MAPVESPNSPPAPELDAPHASAPNIRSRPRRAWVDEHTFAAVADQRITDHIATRARSVDFAGLAGWLPNPDPVLRKAGKSVQVYTDIMTDSHVAGAAQSRKAACMRLEWMLTEEGVTRPDIAAVVRNAIARLKVRRALGEILNAPLFGYWVLEVLWAYVQTPLGVLLLPTAVIGKPASWFTFGEDGGLRFISRDSTLTNGEPVPERKFLVAQHNATYDNPYGEAALSRCFWPVTIKRGGIKAWMNVVERFGQPWVAGEYPEGYTDPQIDDFLAALSDMTQDGVFALPSRAKVNVIPNGYPSNSQIHLDMISWCNAEASKAILGHSGSSDSTPGKLGGEDLAGGVRADFAEADQQTAEAVFNQLIDWVYDLNWDVAPEERPRFAMFQEQDVDKALADRDKVLYDSGVRFTKQYYANAYDLAVEDFELVDASAQQSPQGPSGAQGGAFAARVGARAAAMLLASLSGTYAATAAPRNAQEFPDQVVVDDLAAAVPPEEWAATMEPIVALLEEYMSGHTDYDGALAKLGDLYGNLPVGVLEQTLASSLTIAQAVGRTAVTNEGDA